MRHAVDPVYLEAVSFMDGEAVSRPLLLFIIQERFNIIASVCFYRYPIPAYRLTGAARLLHDCCTGPITTDSGCQAFLNYY